MTITSDVRLLPDTVIVRCADGPAPNTYVKPDKLIGVTVSIGVAGAVTVPEQVTVLDAAPAELMLMLSLYEPTDKPDFNLTYTMVLAIVPPAGVKVTLAPKPLPDVVDTS